MNFSLAFIFLLLFDVKAFFLKDKPSPFSFPILLERHVILPTLEKTLVIPFAKSSNSPSLKKILKGALAVQKCGQNCVAMCSVDYNSYIVVFEGSKIKISKLENIYPCVVPPVIYDGKAYGIDMKGNFCEWKLEFFYGSYISRKWDPKALLPQRCTQLGEKESFLLFEPKIKKYDGKLLILYGNEIFEFSGKAIYPVAVADDQIVWFDKVFGKLAVATSKKLMFFEDGKKIWERELGRIKGADAKDGRIFVVSGNSLLKFKVNAKKVWEIRFKGAGRLSFPKAFGKDKVALIVEFGKMTRDVFGSWKISLVIIKDGQKPKISKSFKVPSFSNFIYSEKENLMFFGENGEAFLFSLIK